MRNQSALVVGPVNAIWDIDNLKLHLRIQHSSDDAILADYAAAAAEQLDGIDGTLQVALISQTWRDFWPDFASVGVLRLHPVQSISSVKYLDADGVEQTVAAGDWFAIEDPKGKRVCFVDGAPSVTSLSSRPDAVRVEYVAGFGDDAAKVPNRIRQAHRLLVGHYYENREAVAHIASGKFETLPLAVSSLLGPFRRFGVDAWANQ